MKIQYNIPKLEQILRDLSILTGISVSFLDTERKGLCHRAKEHDFCTEIQKDATIHAKCAESDRTIVETCRQSRCFESHICHAGLYDAVIPIIKNGLIAGYVIMGRIRSTKSPERADTDCEVLNALYQQMPYFTDEQIESLRSLLQDILFESAIELDTDNAIDDIARFIQTHLDEELTVDSLCARFYVSRNYLYQGIKRYYDVTVNEYISRLRLEKAKQLLTKTKDPIRIICEQVGIHNYTYFCKWFKKNAGVSPTQFRGVK